MSDLLYAAAAVAGEIVLAVIAINAYAFVAAWLAMRGMSTKETK